MFDIQSIRYIDVVLSIYECFFFINAKNKNFYCIFIDFRNIAMHLILLVFIILTDYFNLFNVQ